MTTLQDIMGLITKRKIKSPSDNDYIISAAYGNANERLKPQPKMEASLLTVGGIKRHVLASIEPPKYKVFTAIVSQSGGDNVVVVDTGDLTIGATYLINNPSVESDFTNVGAPNNLSGTYFIATGANPNNWGTNPSILAYNEGAPIAIILENTIGNVWFTYDSVGKYPLNSNNLFMESKTFINGANFGTPVFNRIIGSGGESFENQYGYFFYKDNELVVSLRTLSDPQIFADDILNSAICIEIRVYN